MEHIGSTFLCGCAVDHELVFFAKSLDKFTEKGTENSSFFMRYDGEWYKYKFGGTWTAISIATIKPPGGTRTVVAISPRGAYWEVNAVSMEETNGEIKSWKYPLRSLAVIDHVIYACGMGRTVLKRKSEVEWEEIGPDVSETDGNTIIGFEGLSGFSSDELYAVGWQGEIWLFTGTWQRLPSPVIGNLNAVHCAPDGMVYVVGDNGLMLRGRYDSWELLESGINYDLRDVSSYNEIVYISTDFEIFKVQGNSLIREHDFTNPDDRPKTCLHLLEAADGLVSMGLKDYFRLQNGKWERLV